MALATISASLTPTRRQAERLDKAKDEHVLIHDGKRIVVTHGPEATTGCGNPKLIVVIGSRGEIDEEIKRLGLTTLTDTDGDAPEVET